MKYRKFEKLGIETSLLGFGCMRFPQNNDGLINRELSTKMLDIAISNGVNYIDTAYGYHNGESESFVGEALKKYERSKFYLATKLPVWLLKEDGDVEKIFNEQLKKLQVDYVDFYLLHSMNKKSWNYVKEHDVINICKKFKAEGKIRYLGFSFHDSYEVFEEIITSNDWDFCQIQFNYMDTQTQAGIKGYELAEKLGIPLVIMEPIKGGGLANIPPYIEEIFKKKRPNDSSASWALRYVASYPNVKVILSGMSSINQVKDNLETINNYQALNEDEFVTINEVVELLKKCTNNNCTGCRYCMPCPHGVNIPLCFFAWNQSAKYRNQVQFSWPYMDAINRNEDASKCIKCGKCLALCPQKINIPLDLEKVKEQFTKK